MSTRLRHLLTIVALTLLGVRALAPLGYMPASAGTGLLYELCPQGMPAEIMRALSGGGHHHHHGGDHGDDKAGPSESCPIGHMLASVMATDVDTPTLVLPEPEAFVIPSNAAIASRSGCHYRCRSPPA